MRKPSLIGILNCTNDSFYDGGWHFEKENAIAHGIHLYKLGADLVDVGGQSTRPGAKKIAICEELARVIPVIEELNKQKIPLSIDTFNAEVAQKAIEHGVQFINDITGFSSEGMRIVAAESKVKICVMHMQGCPENMQESPSYPNGVIEEIVSFFENRINLLLQAGVAEENITIDPGIGFGKTVSHNLEILKNLKTIKMKLNFPLYLGTSRKSFMSKILGIPADQLLAATLSANAYSFPHFDYLRIHDVKEHRQMIDLLYFFNNSIG